MGGFINSFPTHNIMCGSKKKNMDDPKEIFAVVIGINYVGTRYSLKGCAKDAARMMSMLTNILGVPRNNIILLSDVKPSDGIPTAHNIRSSMEWLVEKSSGAKKAFFHFSGHGSRTIDRSGDEKDGYDEFIVPSDYPGRIITDDEIYRRMFVKIKCPIIALMDCCHSGTAGDLLYQYNLESNTFRIVGNPQTSHSNTQQILISGCKDSQTSADYYDPRLRDYGGAMTNAFLNALVSNNYSLSYRELLTEMYSFLTKLKMSQKPQLTSNLKINMNQRILISPKPQSFIDPDDSVVEDDILPSENKKYIDLLLGKIKHLEKVNLELNNKLKSVQEKVNLVSSSISDIKDTVEK